MRWGLNAYVNGSALWKSRYDFELAEKQSKIAAIKIGTERRKLLLFVFDSFRWTQSVWTWGSKITESAKEESQREIHFRHSSCGGRRSSANSRSYSTKKDSTLLPQARRDFRLQSQLIMPPPAAAWTVMEGDYRNILARRSSSFHVRIASPPVFWLRRKAARRFNKKELQIRTWWGQEPLFEVKVSLFVLPGQSQK